MGFDEKFIQEVELEYIPKDEYYANIPAIKNLKRLKFKTPITYFVGENGSGKSTLLEAIAVAYGLNPEGGSRYARFKTKNTHSSLKDHIKLIKSYKMPKDSFFLRAETYYNVASYIEESYAREINSGYNLEREYGGIPHQISHGQAFMGLIMNRFDENGLYILDEPEAALSPQNQMSFIIKLHELAKNGSQFIIATHSPIIASLPGSTIYKFDETIKEIDYEDMDSFKIMELMINDRKRMLFNLLRKD